MILFAAGLYSADAQVRGPICNVRFAVYGNTIYPSEVHAVRGLVRVVIEMFSARTSAVVIDRIEGKNGVNAGEVAHGIRARHGEGVFTLEPGNYEVYSKESPHLRALLVVDPK